MTVTQGSFIHASFYSPTFGTACFSYFYIHNKVLVAGCLFAFPKLVERTRWSTLWSSWRILLKLPPPQTGLNIGTSGSTRLITDKRRPQLPSGDMPIYPSISVNQRTRPWRQSAAMALGSGCNSNHWSPLSHLFILVKGLLRYLGYIYCRISQCLILLAVSYFYGVCLGIARFGFYSLHPFSKTHGERPR